jgi:hypothetical protein
VFDRLAEARINVSLTLGRCARGSGAGAADRAGRRPAARGGTKTFSVLDSDSRVKRAGGRCGGDAARPQ